MRDILFYIKLFMSGIGWGFDDARVIFILRIVLAIYFVLRKVFYKDQLYYAYQVRGRATIKERDYLD